MTVCPPFCLPLHLCIIRCTPLDYAKLYNQTDCVDVLVAAGATTRADIVVLAATMIQSAYRGYRLAIIYGQTILNLLLFLGLVN